MDTGLLLPFLLLLISVFLTTLLTEACSRSSSPSPPTPSPSPRQPASPLSPSATGDDESPVPAGHYANDGFHYSNDNSTKGSGNSTKNVVKNGHRQNCTAEETKIAACLNGGICFTIDLNGDGLREPFCHCVHFEIGNRCEQMVYIPGSTDITSDDTMQMVTVIVIVVAAVLFIAFVVVMFLFCRNKRKGIYHRRTCNCSFYTPV